MLTCSKAKFIASFTKLFISRISDHGATIDIDSMVFTICPVKLFAKFADDVKM
jgi:hypothetical protein